MSAPAQRRGERGALASSTAALAAASVIALAAIYYVLSGADDDPQIKTSTTPTATSTPSLSGSPSATPTATPEPTPAAVETTPALRRSDYAVMVFNNSSITGLANSTAERLEALRWVVAGADNWSGAIPESTIYYSKGQRAAAELLARDLGIERLRPRQPGMGLGRLTLILTGELG